MKNKIVLWGTNEAEERILVALELKVKENKVAITTFSEEIATDDFFQEMMDTWRNDQGEVVFPEGHKTIIRELSISEALLPDSIKTERGDIVKRAQTEWHFVVLSSKLSEAYRTELQELEDKLGSLRNYDKELWNGLKGFWSKVQQQISDRTLLREHADELRSRTNKAFDSMKTLRTKMDEEFRSHSKENMDRFTSAIDNIEAQIKENKHLSRVFNDLKKLQKELKDVSFTREHRNKMWQRIDSAFKEVKEKRFGEKSPEDNSPVDRLTARYNGLLTALEKMERSIKRDDDDLAFQERKINRTDGQLEAQIRQAKTQLIKQRVESKREKFSEMLKTKEQLEARIAKEKNQQARREEQAKTEAARKEAADKAKEKIAEDIRQKQESLGDTSDKLETAAKAINEQKGGKKTTAATPQEADAAPEAVESSLLSAISETVGESLEDVVDTVKAVAQVVGEKLEEVVEEVKEEIAEVKEEVKEEVAEIKEEAQELTAEVKAKLNGEEE